MNIDQLFIDPYDGDSIIHKQSMIIRRYDLVLKCIHDNPESFLTITPQFTAVQCLAIHSRVLNEIIQQYLEQEDGRESLLKIIQWFLNHVFLKRHNFKTIFQHIKTKMYSEQLTIQYIQAVITLLHNIFEDHKFMALMPVSTFHFNGQGSGIVVDTREMRWLYQKGLTLQMWLNSYKYQKSILMHMMSDRKSGFQLLLIDNKLIYQYIDNSNNSATLSLLELPHNEWVSLNVQIQSQRFLLSESFYIYVSCNNQQLKEIKVDFPSLSFDSAVVELQFCVNFYGQMSTVMLFNDGFDGNQLFCGDIRFGIQSNSHLRTMTKSLDKYASKLILCYTPLRTRSNFIIDPINKYDGSLQQHSGSYIRAGVQQQLNQFCPLENFVPLLIFLNKCPYPSLLNELLELFCRIIKNRPEAQQDAVKIELLSIVAIKINEDGLNLINTHTIEILSQLKHSLLEKKLKEQFISCFLWRINIYKVNNFEILDDYLKFIRMVYNSNTEFYIKVFGIKQILEILVYDIDPTNRLCCEEHANQMGYTNVNVPKISYKEQMEAYLNIIEAILFYQFFDSDQKIEYFNILEIARVFTQKCSPCFYQLLLQRIQKLFYYEKQGHHPISEIFIKQDIMQMLLNLLTTCSCPDVKTSCIKLIAESIRLNKSKDESMIANWIAHTLGNSAAVEVQSDNEEDSIDNEERKPIENQALLFHQQGSLEENYKEEVVVQREVKQIEVTQKRIIDYEPLYVAIMEWMLRTRVGKTNSDTFILDESYVIRSEGGLQLLMSYFQYCVDQVKGRIMQDLCMLVKWNDESSRFLLYNEEFHWWISGIILDMQYEYNNRELNQFEFWIWDCGLKLYSTILKHALIYEKNAFIRIPQIQSYCKVLEKPMRSLGTQFFIRFIIKQTLQSSMDCCKLDIMSQFWLNMYSVLFEVFRIIFFDPRTLNHQPQYSFYKFKECCNQFTIFTDEIPLKWKQTFGSIQWIDSIFFQNISEIITQYCMKLSPQLHGNLEDFQLVQKAVQQLLDPKYSVEHQRFFDTLLFQYNFGFSKGIHFVQVAQLLLQVGIEFYALNSSSSEHIKMLNSLLSTYDKLFRTFIIVIENSREKQLDEDEEKFLYQIIGSHFHFLYQLNARVEESNLDQTVKQDSLYSVQQTIQVGCKFMIIYVDVIANMFGKFESYYQLICEAYRPSQASPLKLYLIRMLKDLYRRDGTNLFEVKEAKTLKLNNKLILQKMMSSAEIFLGTQSLVEMVEHLLFVGEEFYLLMKMDFEDGCRIFEQKLTNLQHEQISQRQIYEEVLFNLMLTNVTYDQKIQKIDSEQVYLRRAKYMFKKAFNKVRVFNQWWVHPDFIVQQDKQFNRNEMEFEYLLTNKIYCWKIWKYETKQKCRPLLKFKLYDYPETQVAIIEEQKNFRIMNLADHDRRRRQKSITQKAIKEKPKETLFSPLKSLFKSDDNINDELEFNKVQWIKTLTVRLGSLRITEESLIFYFESINQKETHQSLIKFRVPEDSQLMKVWGLDQIYDLQFRRYIGRWTSIELVLLEGSTLVFNFPLKDHQLMIERLKKVCCNIKPRIFQSIKLDPPGVFSESKALTKWYNYKITNFEYLMKLNKISGRSHKDLTQYPVVPWIMNDGEQLHRYRDLSKSMGNLGNAERVEVFMQRYNMIDHFNKVPQFHYGSHYSSPAIIFHYLIRLKPFADGARELQSGKFDLPDRLFFSFTETYRNSVEEFSDVRELIPEFYYMPEMFLNLNKYDYGVQQTGNRVNSVELPGWSGQNPYLFICGHRMEMESDYVSKDINAWIDLIFGYKQKGEEAVKALNTFYYLTYENALDWDKITNEKQKVSLESQAIHFGQCPSQVFTTPHPTRGKPKLIKRIVDEKPQEKIFRQKTPNTNTQFYRSKAIIRMQYISDNKLWLIRRNGDVNIAKISNTMEVTWNKEYSLNLENFVEENAFIFDWTCAFDELPILNKGKMVFIGGVWDGRLLAFNGDQFVESYDEQDSTITVIRQDYKMKILATGSKSGYLCIYQYRNTGRQLKLIARHQHHDDTILDIFIDDDLKVILTASQDGWIHMYNMWSGKYLRSYRHPKGLPISKVCSFCTPLYGIAFYENRNLYSYSINGQFLMKQQLPQNIVNQAHIKVVKDSQLNDVIVVPLAMEKKLVFFTTPFLRQRSEIKLANQAPAMNDVTVFAISPDRSTIAFGTSDGEFGLCLDIRNLQQ